MMGKDNKISNFQISILLINTIIGVGILSLPKTLAEIVGTSGWVSILTSGLIVMILVSVIMKIMEMYEGKSIFEISKELIGTALTYIIMVIFVIYNVGLSSFVVRIFSEVVKLLLLYSTPIHVVIITILLAASYATRCGIETMARFTLIIIPFLIVPVLIISIVLIPDLDYSNLLPLFRFNATQLVKSIPTSFFSFSGFELLLIYMAYSENPKSALKYNLTAVVTVIAIYLIYFVISTARFGVAGLKVQIWPLLSLTKTIEIPSAFIENLDGIVMAIWVLIAFTTLMSYLYSASLITSKLFKVKEYKYFVLPLVPIVYIISLIPQNVVEVYKYIDIFVYILGGFFAVILPILFLILAKFKKKEEKQKNE